MMFSSSPATKDPLQVLDRWLTEARDIDLPAPAAMTLVTATSDGQPSARVVSLKRLEPEALVFTTGLWTRKAKELRDNPNVATVFHWPPLGRQVRLEGRAEVAEDKLAEELFGERPRDHQLQTLVSRQGQPIDGTDALRRRLEEMRSETAGRPIPCPANWGAVRIAPERIEFWEEGASRLHDRLLFIRGEAGWQATRLAP